MKMRAANLLTAFLICLLPALSNALEPMDDFAMDNVRAQSGIAIGLDNIQIYSHSGWGYEATLPSGDGNKKIEFNDTSSYMILNTRNPITFRVMQSPDPDSVAMLEITGQPSVWMEMNTNDFSFAGQDMGSLHLSLRPPDGALMGFMEEFVLYAAPLGQYGNAGDGIAFQLETRSGIEEYRWNYNEELDEFHFGGVYMAGAFGENTELDDPSLWNPTGRFVIGNLDPYANDSPLGPASFQVLPDEDAPSDQGYAILRLNMPMQGSFRIGEVGMFSYGEIDQGPQAAPEWPLEPADNPVQEGYRPDDFGPMIVDGMTIHHLQVDFKTYEQP